MLIFLTHANHLYADRKQVRKMQPYPPLQTLIAAALLRREGHSVLLHDSTFDRDALRAIERAKPDLVAVIEDNFNFLTKMCLETNRTLAFECAAGAKALGIPAVVNSSDATGDPQAYLNAGFTAVIQGEVEDTLRDLCRKWPEPVPGVFGMPPRPAIHDLDALPIPAWDLVDIERYRSAWREAHGYFSVNLAASRGCPYRCNWCAKPIHGDAYRTQSPGRVVAEMECVQDLLRPDHIWFADDIFGLSGKWLREFAACAEQSGLRVPFKIQSRADLMSRDTVASLAAAGCADVWLGAESGSQPILNRMQKGITVPQVLEACDTLRAHGVRPNLFLQFGYPGEEWHDIEATLAMLRAARPHDIGVSVSYPLPGTKFFQIVNAGPSQQHWHDSDDVGRVSIGAFTTSFYRALADALHLEVRSGLPAAADAWERVEALRCVSC